LRWWTDAPAGAHAAAGDDDGAALDAVERHGFVGALGGAQDGQPLADLGGAGAAHVFAVDVGDLADVLQVDVVGLGGHGAVEVDDLLRQAAFLVKASEVVDQVLRAAHGERGDQHVASFVVRSLEDAGQFQQGLVGVAVIAVAVGGFQQHHVGAGQGRGCAHER